MEHPCLHRLPPPLIENHAKVYSERKPGESTWTVSAVNFDGYPLDGRDDGDHVVDYYDDDDEPGDLNKVDLPTAAELLAALREAAASITPTASLAVPKARVEKWDPLRTLAATPRKHLSRRSSSTGAAASHTRARQAPRFPAPPRKVIRMSSLSPIVNRPWGLVLRRPDKLIQVWLQDDRTDLLRAAAAQRLNGDPLALLLDLEARHPRLHERLQRVASRR